MFEMKIIKVLGVFPQTCLNLLKSHTERKDLKMNKFLATAAVVATLSTPALAHNPATPTFWGEFFKLTQMHSLTVENAEFARKKYAGDPAFAPSHRPVVDIVKVDYTVHPVTCDELMARKGYLESFSLKYDDARIDIRSGQRARVWAKDDKVVTCRNANPAAANYNVTAVIFDREALDNAISQANANLQKGYGVQNHSNLNELGKL